MVHVSPTILLNAAMILTHRSIKFHPQSYCMHCLIAVVVYFHLCVTVLMTCLVWPFTATVLNDVFGGCDADVKLSDCTCTLGLLELV
jgi:hypothetical protein